MHWEISWWTSKSAHSASSDSGINAIARSAIALNNIGVACNAINLYQKL